MADDLKGAASELAKKVLTVGMGAVFLTEESLRGLVSELKLPKEIIAGVLESANKTKNEFLGKLSKDALDRIMEHVEPKALIEEILAKHEIELSVRINFKRKNAE